MKNEHKVGDRVQIIDVDEIGGGRRYWKNGDICKILRIDNDGLLKVSTADEGDFYYVHVSELHAIQPVEKPIKQSNQEFIEQIEKVNRDIERYNETAKQCYYRTLETDVEITAETESVFNELMINFALDTGDRELFMQLTQKEMAT